MPSLLEKIKLSLRITTEAFDSEITDLIASAKKDLGLVGVDNPDTDPLIERAVITYAQMYFGIAENFEKLKQSYDEQKAQMITATGYGIKDE